MGDVFLAEVGKTVIFVLSDQKDLYPFLAHWGTRSERNEGLWPYNGSTRQKYIWTEDYDPNYWPQQRGARKFSDGQLPNASYFELIKLEYELD